MGFIGYPNVGKSSVINTLKADRVCKTAPIPGETKVNEAVNKEQLKIGVLLPEAICVGVDVLLLRLNALAILLLLSPFLPVFFLYEAVAFCSTPVSVFPRCGST